jgi:tripartite-type tricarboxylate transporter receptor subunit TctC
MPFDWQKDLALLTLVARVPEVVVIHPSLAANTLQDLVAYARAARARSVTARPAPEASPILWSSC